MKAHILFIADGRSPTTQSWIRHTQTLNYRTSLISTYPCQPLENLENFEVQPIAFSRFSRGSNHKNTSAKKSPLRDLRKRITPILQFIRYRLGPLTVTQDQGKYQDLLKAIKPDLVHALRIPYEGMLASFTPPNIPLIVSTWGNDLTLHANKGWLMGRLTRRCLSRVDGLISDTQRDARLAIDWGLQPSKPKLVTVGSGGIDLAAIQASQGFSPSKYGIPKNATWVVNPRGLRPGSVHQEVFFEAIPKVHQRHPEVCFLCPNLASLKEAESWVQTFNLDDRTFLLPRLPQNELWSLFKLSRVFVSPSSHDGTPNALLEAMACGCFPIVGDIESMREWLTDGENGFLINPHDSNALAEGICKALEGPQLINEAADQNLAIIKNKAALNQTLPRIAAFYERFTTR